MIVIVIIVIVVIVIVIVIDVGQRIFTKYENQSVYQVDPLSGTISYPNTDSDSDLDPYVLHFAVNSYTFKP